MATGALTQWTHSDTADEFEIQGRTNRAFGPEAGLGALSSGQRGAGRGSQEALGGPEREIGSGVSHVIEGDRAELFLKSGQLFRSLQVARAVARQHAVENAQLGGDGVRELCVRGSDQQGSAALLAMASHQLDHFAPIREGRGVDVRALRDLPLEPSPTLHERREGPHNR